MSNNDSIYVERNGVYNHWGIWVDPETPITGVISNNQVIQFLVDEIFDGIDLDWIEHVESSEHDLDDPDYCDICEFWDMSQSTILIGDWIRDSNGLYDYDPMGDYAAIVRESTTQVVYSKYIRKAGLCSPCYPGQADMESDGQFLAYDLPPEAYEY